MSARTALDLLPAVRLYVLHKAASGSTGIALSRCAAFVNPPSRLAVLNGQKQSSRFWFGGPARIRWAKPTRRGHVQRCLSELAKSGLMWERQRPESVMYEPADKFFQIRITKDAALAELKKLGEAPWPKPIELSAHWSPSLGKQ